MELASFDDRYTMRHTRVFAHAIEDVFGAVTRTEEMNLWMMPFCEVEARLGGECAFTWGGAWRKPRERRGEIGTVTAFEPPTLVEYTLPTSVLRFELHALGSSETRLVFIHHMKAQGLPALTMWHPNVVTAFDFMLNDLGALLADTLDRKDAAAQMRAAREGRLEAFLVDPERAPRHIPEEVRRQSSVVTARYALHIAEHCPPDESEGSMERDLGPFTQAVAAVADEEVAAWAEVSGGYGPLLDLMFKELRQRLTPTTTCALGFNLGPGLEWVFAIDPPDVALTRRPTTNVKATVVGPPAGMARVLATGLGWDALDGAGCAIKGPRKTVADFWAMVPVPDAVQSNRDRDILHRAVAGRTDKQIAAFAAGLGGYERLLAMVFNVIAGRLEGSGDRTVAFDFGDGLGFVVSVAGGKPQVTQRAAKRREAIWRSSPADFLRVIMQDLDADEATRAGRLSIVGDLSEVRWLFPQLSGGERQPAIK